MRIRFPDIEAEPFEELLLYQWEEITDFLRKYHYSVRVEDYGIYDPQLSWVAYDTQFRPRAVLLSTVQEEGIAIELLFGFSKSKPQYILSVCQGFAQGLGGYLQKTDPEKIFIYSCTDQVMPLLKRLLDSKYGLKQEFAVVKAIKDIADAGTRPDRDLSGGRNVWYWQKETARVFGQRHINDKAEWSAFEH